MSPRSIKQQILRSMSAGFTFVRFGVMGQFGSLARLVKRIDFRFPPELSEGIDKRLLKNLRSVLVDVVVKGGTAATK